MRSPTALLVVRPARISQKVKRLISATISAMGVHGAFAIQRKTSECFGIVSVDTQNDNIEVQALLTIPPDLLRVILHFSA